MLRPNINEYELEKIIYNIGVGNKDALSELYNLTKTSVYGFALSILKNWHEAEDVLQDVYIKIYENASGYRSKSKPMAWILTITKNLSLMKLRSNKNHFDIDELKEILPSNKNINDPEAKMILEIAFKYINDEERNILVLHSVAGFKYREIAKILDMPLATVLSKYNRAIKKIKNRMREDNI